MNFLLASKEENGHKSGSPILCNYCTLFFKNQTALSAHLRVNHADELAKSKGALPSDARSTVLGLPCQPIGRSARARIINCTFFVKGSSSSSNISPVPPTESSPKNSENKPEKYKELSGTMPFMPPNLSAGGSGGGGNSHLTPLSFTAVTTSRSNSEAAGGNFGADGSSSLQPSFLSKSKTFHPVHSNHRVPTLLLSNPPAYNFSGTPHHACTVTNHLPGAPPFVPFKLKGSTHTVCLPSGFFKIVGPMKVDVGGQPLSPPLGLHGSCGPHQFAAGMHPMKYPIHDKRSHGKKTRASLMGILGKPKSGRSSRPPKPGCSSSAPKLDLVLSGAGVSSTSLKEEDHEELDLSLHL